MKNETNSHNIDIYITVVVTLLLLVIITALNAAQCKEPLVVKKSPTPIQQPAKPPVVMPKGEPAPVDDTKAQLEVFRIRLERAEKTARRLQDELTELRSAKVTVPKNLPTSPDEAFYLNLAKSSAVDNAEIGNETWRRLMAVENLIQWQYGIEIDPWGGMRKMEVKPEWPERLKPTQNTQDKQ